MNRIASSSSRIGLLLAGYTVQRTKAALAQCDRSFTGPMFRNRILIANSPDVQALTADGWKVIRGSNELGEFSAWQEGLATLRESHEVAGVLFLNDTLGAHRRMSVFRRWALLTEILDAGGASALGFLEDSKSAKAGMTIRDQPLSQWASSFCFLLTRETLDQLGHRLYELSDVAGCVNGGSDEASFFSDQLSPALRDHLRWWLFKGWYRSVPLDASSQDALAFKARCICAELILSARCLGLGVEWRDPMERHPLARALDRINALRLSVSRAPVPRWRNC